MLTYKNHKVKVWLKDGALIGGIMLGTDEEGNLLLSDADERYKKAERRYLGLIVIIGSLINNVKSVFKVPKTKQSDGS